VQPEPFKEPGLAKGWRRDILNAIRTLNKIEFTNKDLYELLPHFKKNYPNNKFIEEKIRQQLQNLCRDGRLIHVKSGHWRISW
jgi:type II restriction enzyme